MTAERARLFVALELPEEVRAELVRWREDVVRDVEGLRPIRPRNLHVTLCFLGWCDVGEIDAIVAACASVRPRLPGLALDQVRWLPKRRPRALAVAVSDPAGALAKTQAALSRVLERGGWYTPEARPFLAHVTVARASSEARLRATALTPPQPASLDRARIVLYRSRLAPGGAQYEPLSTFS